MQPTRMDRIERLANSGLEGARQRKERPPVRFLPDPSPRPRDLAVISVDDHVIEPPDMFEGRIPKKFAELGPVVVELENGTQLWRIEDQLVPNIGLNATVGKEEGSTTEPQRFDEMRRGTWDIEERIRDLDIDGVWASLCFPSALSGFAGWKYSRLKNQEFGLAVMHAWNDWMIEEWAGPHPDRIIPCQITWLNDPAIAAEEIRRNAERGFKAVSFTQAPHQLGYPSLYSGHWDPLFRACEETETVVCLHFGTGAPSEADMAPDAPTDPFVFLLPFQGVFAIADWIFSEVPLRFPGLKVALSECGIGWVPFAIDRLDYLEVRRKGLKRWSGTEMTAAECLTKTFWFCALGDRAGYQMRDLIGVDHILSESDYPHEDTTWPNTQAFLNAALGDLPAHDRDLITYKNAASLFRHDTSGLEEWAKAVQTT